MADPEHHDHHSSDSHDQHNRDKKSDFDKMADKYQELKEDPKVQATRSLFANYFVEIFYLIATVIAFIYSLIHSPRTALVFVGIGFLLGLFLFSVMKNATQMLSNFLKKQSGLRSWIVGKNEGKNDETMVGFCLDS